MVVKRSVIFRLILLSAACLGLFGCASTSPVNESESVALVRAINIYRQQHGLPPVKLSPTMMAVARAHVADMETNNPLYGACNLHSWSERGEWSGCCYRADHRQPYCMWDKPKEISQGLYRGKGFEIATYNSHGLNRRKAIDQWIRSKGHHDIILNREIWSVADWKAVGAAISNNFAVIWFGELEDPALQQAVGSNP